MRFRVGKKLGDTLIEVTIAIGVFSLVAIVVISVISGSTSGAQANLETTVTREEMDSQAEALRFLQDAYLGEGTEGTKYANVWKAITANAINADEDMSYNPSTCDETLDDITKNHGFVINYRALGTGDVKQILLRPTSLSGSGTTSFETAKTYPRLLYGAPDSDSLIDDKRLAIPPLSKRQKVSILSQYATTKLTLPKEVPLVPSLLTMIFIFALVGTHLVQTLRPPSPRLCVCMIQM